VATSAKLRSRLLISVVSVVIILIVMDTLITTRNNTIIEDNRSLQKEAETVKVEISHFAINIIHNLDLGLRSYALFNDPKYLPPLYFAVRDKDSILLAVENTLRNQQYPLQEYYTLRDSINAYAALCVKLKKLYDSHQHQEFMRLANMDKGYHLWLQYERFAKKVYAFEDAINVQATHQYNKALYNNYLVQLILFLVSVPALLIMAWHTRKKFSMAQQIQKLDMEKAELLTEQNIRLEKMVKERTGEIRHKNEELETRNKEIAAQNEELTAQQEQITTQRDLLASQNEKLVEARSIIEEKNERIQNQNAILEQQVEERTKELVQYNLQLEKFTFMAAHDLRSPVARILGLGRILSMSRNEEETKTIVSKLVQSTYDLDIIVNELGRILEIKGDGKRKITEIDFQSESANIQSKLKREIFESKATITTDFGKAPIIHSVKKYFRTILFHILHNAIKFRHPARRPFIHMQSEPCEDFICLSITDNGIGIDTELYGDQLFEFHKRFHDHVQGKGLGLYLARIQMIALDGKIELNSKPDLGTTVKLYFPKNPDREL